METPWRRPESIAIRLPGLTRRKELQATRRIQTLRTFRRANSYGDDFDDFVDFEEFFDNFWKESCWILVCIFVENDSKMPPKNIKNVTKKHTEQPMKKSPKMKQEKPESA